MNGAAINMQIIDHYFGTEYGQYGGTGTWNYAIRVNIDNLSVKYTNANLYAINLN
jgi:hypothetical protein